MDKLVIGSLNEHKAREMLAMLANASDLRSAGRPVQVCLLSEFAGVRPVPETGVTLRDNARLKALGFAAQIGEVVVADDSGLEVDALDGAPGVKSARYAGLNGTYEQVVAKLLREMNGVPTEKRTARFRCCICMASPDMVLLEADGACEGSIIFEPRGTSGFGYDPVFLPTGYDRTFAELDAETKNRISHRGAAMAKFKGKLAAFLMEKGRE